MALVPQEKPGLSSYASDPEAAAESLLSLLKEAENVVPRNLRSNTPVRVGVSVLFIKIFHIIQFQKF